MQALSTAVPGKWYTIKWMFGVPEVLEKLKEFKIKEGSEIHVIHLTRSGSLSARMPLREFKYNKEMKNRSYNHRKSRIDFFVYPDHGGASLFDFIKFSQNNGLFSAAIEDIILLCNKIEARKRENKC